MDMVFSFIGVCSEHQDLKSVQLKSLNLFDEVFEGSRATAGTTSTMPGATDSHAVFNSLKQQFPMKEQPKLLSVSCGYFKNIVMKILFKQKEKVLKYLLLTTGGVFFDKLVAYSGEHYSIASLLMEIMQVNYSSLDSQLNSNNEDKWSEDGTVDKVVDKAEPEDPEKEELTGLLQQKKREVIQ